VQNSGKIEDKQKTQNKEFHSVWLCV